MLISNHLNVSFKKSGPAERDSYFALHFTVDADLSILFAYINSAVHGAVYHEKPHCIKFSYKNRVVILHPDEIVSGPFLHRKDALQFIPEIIEFLNDMYKQRAFIEPNYKMKRYVPVLDIYRLLPGTNCGTCRYPTCMAFAAAVSKGDVFPDTCPSISNPISEKLVYPIRDGEGNLVSTVAIDIDSQKRKHEREKQKEHADKLKKKIRARIKKGKKSLDGNLSKFGLTNRETEVLRLMAEGFTNNEISELLSISPHTVKSHVLHVFNKIGVNDRTLASVWAARHKVI